MMFPEVGINRKPGFVSSNHKLIKSGFYLFLLISAFYLFLLIIPLSLIAIFHIRVS